MRAALGPVRPTRGSGTETSSHLSMFPSLLSRRVSWPGERFPAVCMGATAWSLGPSSECRGWGGNPARDWLFEKPLPSSCLKFPQCLSPVLPAEPSAGTG